MSLGMLLAAVVCACSASIPAPARRDLVLAGPIDSRAAVAFEQTLAAAGDAPRVVVTSLGGDALGAMRIGRRLRRLDATIVVRGACMSACAQYLLPAAKSVEIEPGSLIVLHSSPSGMATVLAASSPRASAAFDHAVATEKAYLRSLGTSGSLLRSAALLMRPVCFSENPTRSTDDPARYGVGWAHTGVLFDDAVLRSYGIRIVRGRQPTPAELPAAIGHLGLHGRFRPVVYPSSLLIGEASGSPAPVLASCPIIASALR